MPPKFYAFLWTLFLAVIGITWITGMFTIWATIAFGFVSFGMVFMGMMLVLPFVATHGENAPHAVDELVPAKAVTDKQTGRAAHGFATPHHV